MAIDIKPENKGKYTARADSHRKSIGSQIKSDIGGAHGEKQRKRAQFAANMRKIARKHKRGSKRR